VNSNWRRIWYDEGTGRLRSGWRVLAFIGIALLVSNLLMAVQIIPVAGMRDPLKLPAYLQQLLASVAMIPGFLIAGIWALRRFDHLPAYTLGLTPIGPWVRGLLGGLCLGAAAAVALVLIYTGGGLATFVLREPMPGLPALAVVVASLLVIAVAEELVFRGYLFQTLLRGIGPLATVLLMALLFAAWSMQGGKVTPLAFTNQLLFGVLLGLLYLRTGALWLPIGVHGGWNIAAYLLGLPTTGLFAPLPPLFTPHYTITAGLLPLVGPHGESIIAGLFLALLGFFSYSRQGLSLASYWWEWRSLQLSQNQPICWDFAIDGRYYQWKLQVRDQQE